MKKTFYEILGVSAGATDAEIRAAFMRLVKAQGEDGGGPHADAELQLKILNDAYATLSDYERRAGYDASLAARAVPPRLQVEIREPRWSAQKILVLTIGSLLALGLAIQIGFMLLSYRNASGYIAEAQDAKIRLKEYEQEMGPPKSSAEKDEYKRAEEERQQANAARQRERELEESRRYAARITEERLRNEEQAKRQAENEQRRVEEEEARRKQREEDAVRHRLAEEKRRLQELEAQNQR